MWSLVYGSVEHTFDGVDVARVAVGGNSTRSQDVSLPRQDGVAFGQDYVDPGDIVLDLNITVSPYPDPVVARRSVMNQAAAFARKWDALSVRSATGAMAELYADELGMFEGRPRPVEWDYANYAFGHLTGRARFVRSAPTVHPIVGGVVPWNSVSVPVSDGSGTPSAVTVAGTAPAWPVITLRGPLMAGGKLNLTGVWSAHLNRAIPGGTTASIDTRPGRRLMTIGGSPANLLLPTGVGLSGMDIPVGSHTATLVVTTPGAALASTVAWRTTDMA